MNRIEKTYTDLKAEGRAAFNASLASMGQMNARMDAMFLQMAELNANVDAQLAGITGQINTRMSTLQVKPPPTSQPTSTESLGVATF